MEVDVPLFPIMVVNGIAAGQEQGRLSENCHRAAGHIVPGHTVPGHTVP